MNNFKETIAALQRAKAANKTHKVETPKSLAMSLRAKFMHSQSISHKMKLAVHQKHKDKFIGAIKTASPDKTERTER